MKRLFDKLGIKSPQLRDTLEKIRRLEEAKKIKRRESEENAEEVPEKNLPR